MRLLTLLFICSREISLRFSKPKLIFFQLSTKEKGQNVENHADIGIRLINDFIFKSNFTSSCTGSPAILLSNVDFPVPDCPIILKNSFVLTVKSIFSRTFKCSECPSISNFYILILCLIIFIFHRLIR